MISIGKTYADTILSHLNDRLDRLGDIFADIEKVHEYFQSNPDKLATLHVDDIHREFGPIDPYVIYVVKTMIIEHTLDHYDEFYREFKFIFEHNAEVLHVRVTSAVALEEPQKVKLMQELKEKYHKPIVIDTQIDPTVIGGLQIVIGNLLFDDTLQTKLEQMRQYLLHLEHEDDVEIDKFGQELHKKIHDFQLSTGIVEIGEVTSVADSIVFATGLTEIMYNELVVFENGLFGIARNLEEDQVGIIVFGQAVGIREGQIVARTYKIMSVPVGEEMIGRVVNALGEPIDGLGEIHAKQQRAIEQPAYGVMDRQSVNEPLQTGMKAIDALVPIGKGQRELIIGDRKTGKTTIAIDAILNQKNTGVICVYVAIGQKDTTVRSVVNTLREYGALDYTVVVNASSADAPAMLYVAPYSGVTIAEYFMLQGKDVLVVYDDLTRHATAYREISLLLGRPPGREAYPGDVFYLHSRLLERAAKLSDEHGGGSITALPIVETQSSDISAYIPTNIISITDGQIFLESDLFNSGVRPAINAGLSVSRVGGSAQIKAMKKVSGTLRIDLSSYRELEAFSQFGSDLDDATQQKLERGKRVVEVLKQRSHQTLAVEKQVLILYALTHGHLDSLPLELIARFETKLYDQLEATSLGMKITETIRTTKQLPSDEDLDQFITEFKALFMQQVV